MTRLPVTLEDVMLRTLLAMILFAIVVLPATAAAQTMRGSVDGVVRDPTGAVVPGAAVTLTHPETNRSRSTTTDGRGEFIFGPLSAGTYELQIERAGFQTGNHGFTLRLNQNVRIEHELSLTGTDDVVDVVEGELLEVRAASRSTVIDNRQVTQLPLDGRNFFELSLLAPGSAPAADGSAGSARGDFAIHVSGGREDSNAFLLDGVYNGDPKLNGVGITPPVDAIQEFEVLGSNYDPSFGRNSGGQINVAVKSGSNQLHGTVFHFFRNAALDARNRFAPAGESDPKFVRNQFGFTLGGPIRQDRTFFFGDYEGRVRREGITRLTTVPTAAERRGDFTASNLPVPNLPGVGPLPFIPDGFQHPVGRAIAELYPEPNRNDPRANYVSSPTLSNDEHHFDVRVDHMFNDMSELSARYSFADRVLSEPFSGPTFSAVPGFGNDVGRRAQNLMVSETHAFSPQWVNEARFAFHRVAIGVNQEGQGTSINRQVGLPDISTNQRDLGLSFIRISGFSPLGHEFNNPQASESNTFQLIDNVTYIGARHTVKFGGEFRAMSQDAFRDVQSRGLLQFLGVFTGNPVADLLLGLPTVTGVAQVDNPQQLRSNSYATFIHDTFRVRPDLTLTLGLRYDYSSPPVDVDDRANLFDVATGGLVPVGTAGMPRSGYNDDRNNFAPQIGMAWAPNGGDTVVRAGYSLNYNQSALAPGEGLYFNAPFFDFGLFFSLPAQGPFPGYTLTLTDPFPLGSFPFPTPASALTFDRNLRTPYVGHWNLAVQRRFGETRSLEVAYVGSKGTHLIGARDINQPAPSTVTPVQRPNPRFDDIVQVESRSNSIYQSLQTRFQQRFWCGMTMLASYTWSKSTDDASGFFPSAADPNFPQDSNNLAAERARSNFDVQQRFSLGYTYDIPLGPLEGSTWARRVFGGWQTNGIVTLESGRPFTVALLPEFDNSNTGRSVLGFGANDRPNIQGNPALGNPSADAWFDTSAFAVPAFGSFGNAGRNILDGPGFSSWNASVVKTVQAGEFASVEIRAEAFNLFNRANLGTPDSFLGSPTFGQILSARSPRRLQLGVKLLF